MGFQTQIRGTKHLFVGTDNITINTNPMAIGCGDWCESDWRNTPDFPFKSIFWSSLCVQCTCRGKLRIYTSCMCFIVPWPPKRGRLDCFVLLCCLSPVCTKSSKKAIGCQIKHVDFSFKWIVLPQECEEIDKTPPTRTHIQKQQRSRNQAPPMKLCQGFPYKKEKPPRAHCATVRPTLQISLTRTQTYMWNVSWWRWNYGASEKEEADNFVASYLSARTRSGWMHTFANHAHKQ